MRERKKEKKERKKERKKDRQTDKLILFDQNNTDTFIH